MGADNKPLFCLCRSHVWCIVREILYFTGQVHGEIGGMYVFVIFSCGGHVC
jgi:hypothetical protein